MPRSIPPLLLFLMLCSHAARAQAIPPPAAHDAVITLLETNDLHGVVYTPGRAQGLAKIATLVKGVRAAMPNVLLFDAGDMIQGTPDEMLFHGRPILDAMNTMGYTAAAAGNHEFDWGQDVLRDAIGRANFPILSANVLEDDAQGDAATEPAKPWGGLTPYIVRTVDGVRVAAFGLTTPTTADLEWPPAMAGIRFANPIDTARALVPELRVLEHADVVIAVTHLGVATDKALARAVPGIDVILGGHSHTTLSRQLWVGRTLICQTGAHAQALGRVDLLVHKDASGLATVAVNGQGGRWWGYDGAAAPQGLSFPHAPLLPVTADIADDPDVVAAYRPYADKLAPILAERLTTVAAPMSAADIRLEENPVGDMLADAVRAESHADIALIDSGDPDRAGLAAGPLTAGDLYRLLGGYTRRHIVTARVPGAVVRDVFSRLRETDRAPVQVSGVRVADTVTVGGEPVDPGREYTVAAPAYVMEDYFYRKKGVEIVSDDVHGETLRDDAIAYLRGRPPLTPATDGRWQTLPIGG